MTVIVSFEYIGTHAAALAPSESLLGYIYIYNPNNFALQNWPIYVRFTSDNFNFNENIHEQGNNLRFRSLDGSLLNYFLGEWYSGTFGEAFIQVPELPANSTTKIKVTAAPPSAPDLSNFTAVSLEILDGLYAEWRFCHPSNKTIYDSGGSDWHGEIKWVYEDYINKTTGYYDVAFQSGYVSPHDNGGAICPFRSITKTPPFTWEASVYPSDNCESQLIGTYENYVGSRLTIYSNEEIEILVSQMGASVGISNNINFEERHHVVALFSSDYISLYVDESNKSNAVPPDLTDFNENNNPLRIELDENDYTTFYSNTFIKADFIRYWNRILSSDEISLLRAHYGVAVSRFPNKLCVLNWTEDKPQVFIECS